MTTASRSIEPHDGGLRKLVRLLAQPIARLLGERQRVGHVAHVLHQQQLAEMLEELPRQLSEILTPLGDLLDQDERARDVAIDDRVAEPEQRVLLDRRAELEDVLDGDLPLRRGGQLVERRDRVAERSAGAARDEREGRVGCVDAFALADVAQDGDDLLQPGPLEDERLAARADRLDHLRELGRAEDEDEMWRRLLDQLQEGVPCRDVSWCASSTM